MLELEIIKVVVLRKGTVSQVVMEIIIKTVLEEDAISKTVLETESIMKAASDVKTISKAVLKL